MKKLLALLSSLIFTSSFAQNIPISLTSSPYKDTQIPNTPHDQAFFEAWDCWVQRAQSLQMAGPSGNIEQTLILQTAPDCPQLGVSELRFVKNPRHPSYTNDFQAYTLSSPLFELSPLNRQIHSGLSLTARFGRPEIDGTRAEIYKIPIVTFSVEILYYDSAGNSRARGFQNEFASQASWTSIGDRVVATERVRVDCPEGTHWRIQCYEMRSIYERTWLNPLTQERRFSTYR